MKKRIDMQTAGVVIKKIAEWCEETPAANEEKWQYIKRMREKGFINDDKFSEIVNMVFDEMKNDVASKFATEIVHKIIEEME